MKKLFSKIILSLFFLILLTLSKTEANAAYNSYCPTNGYIYTHFCLQMSVTATTVNLPAGKNLYIGCEGDGGNNYVINKSWDSSKKVCVGQYCNGTYGGTNGTNWCEGEIHSIISNNGAATQTGSYKLTHCSCPGGTATDGDGCLKLAISSTTPSMSNACYVPRPNFTGMTPQDLKCTVIPPAGQCGINGTTIYPSVKIVCPTPTPTPTVTPACNVGPVINVKVNCPACSGQ